MPRNECHARILWAKIYFKPEHKRAGFSQNLKKKNIDPAFFSTDSVQKLTHV